MRVLLHKPRNLLLLQNDGFFLTYHQLVVCVTVVRSLLAREFACILHCCTLQQERQIELSVKFVAIKQLLFAEFDCALEPDFGLLDCVKKNDFSH